MAQGLGMVFAMYILTKLRLNSINTMVIAMTKNVLYKTKDENEVRI